MNRRTFLAAVAAVPAALVCPVPVARPLGLAFHPDAFALAFTSLPLTRFDVLFGMGRLAPELGCRVLETTDTDDLNDPIFRLTPQQLDPRRLPA